MCRNALRPSWRIARALACGFVTTILTSWAFGIFAFDSSGALSLGTLTNGDQSADADAVPRAQWPPPSSLGHIVQKSSLGRTVTRVRRADSGSGWREHHSGALMVPYEPICDRPLVFERLIARVPGGVLKGL